MKKLYRRSISGLLALLICFTAILGSGVTAFAAAPTGEIADSYSVAFPRDGDANLDYIRPASSEACVGVGSVCAGARSPGENSEVPGENSGKQLTVI